MAADGPRLGIAIPGFRIPGLAASQTRDFGISQNRTFSSIKR